MRARVEHLLRDLQGAVAVRHLYPGEHPRVVESMARLAAGVDEVTEAGEMSVHAIDQRVVYDGLPLASSEALWRGLFAWLAARGFHRLTVFRGATAEELAAFVSALAEVARGADARVALASSPHLRLSALEAGEVAVPASDAPDAALTVPAAGESLDRVWRGVMDRHTLEFDALDVTVLALIRTVERHQGAMLPLATLRNHDDYTVAHIVNVALLTIALAEVVGFRSPLIRDIGVAALLHDIGKLRVPPEVLNSPGGLTDEQRELIRRHPEDGARILMATPRVPELAVSVAFEHHVHYDGGGYPALPKGWRTNAASEITHIADVFDALRSNRPYRDGLPVEKVSQLMLRDAGTAFSPTLLHAFFDAVVPHASQARVA